MSNIDKTVLFEALSRVGEPVLLVRKCAAGSRIALVSDAASECIGLAADKLLGASWPDCLDEWRESPEGSSDEFRVETVGLSPADGAEWSLVRLTPANGNAPEGVREALAFAASEASSFSSRDSVTGLMSATSFRSVAERLFAAAARDDHRIGILSFTVDAFDAYQEVYGRHAAESCLRKVAHAISGSLRRSSDLAARVEDDQLVVLMDEVDLEGLQSVAQRIATKVRELAVPHPRSPVSRCVTVSVGCLSVAGDECTRSIAQLFAQAGENLAPVSLDTQSLRVVN